MEANINRHAYTDYSGIPYADAQSVPIALAPYAAPSASPNLDNRTIIRKNVINKNNFPPLPNTDCGCDVFGPAPAYAPVPKYAPSPRPSIAPRPRLAPAAYPKAAPVAAPKYAPIVAPRASPVYAPRASPVYAPPHVANLIDDDGQWAETARKDNMYIIYVQNC